MFAKNAHLTDEKEIKAKLDLAEFIKKGKLTAFNLRAPLLLTNYLLCLALLALCPQKPRHCTR